MVYVEEDLKQALPGFVASRRAALCKGNKPQSARSAATNSRILPAAPGARRSSASSISTQSARTAGSAAANAAGVSSAGSKTPSTGSDRSDLGLEGR